MVLIPDCASNGFIEAIRWSLVTVTNISLVISYKFSPFTKMPYYNKTRV